MNKIIKFLMIYDILILTGFGLIEPILAIFFKENLVGGTILTAGIASTIFLIVKCLVQLPFSRYVDSHGYATRLHWLMLGGFLTAIVPFIYVFSSKMYMIYVAQVIFGLGAGLAYPTWLGLWSTHLDKKKESFEWSLYSTLTGIGTALTALVGALLAQYVGFRTTFISVGVLSLAGVISLFNLERKKRLSGIIEPQYQKKRKLIHKHR